MQHVFMLSNVLIVIIDNSCQASVHQSVASVTSSTTNAAPLCLSDASASNVYQHDQTRYLLFASFILLVIHDACQWQL